jgi:nucleoside-diphosphate-sugar epimerase
MSLGSSELDLPCPAEEVDTFLSRPSEKAIEVLRSSEGDIIVLGAGGKMGLHLCALLKRALSELGRTETVYAASRFQSLRDASAFEQLGVKVLKGDFRDVEFVKNLPNCPTVFYLVGAKFGTSENGQLLREINVEVARELAFRYRSSKIVALSTGCVYSYVSPGSGGSTENSDMNPIGEYAQSCVEREKRFQEVSEQFHTPVVLIRLNYSVEFRYGALLDIGQKVFGGEPINLTMSHVNVIWQNDALNHTVQALEIADSPAVPINITGPDTLSVRELADAFGRRFHKRPRFTGAGAESMWLSNASKSHQLFGFPEVGIEKMLDWTAAWILEEGETHGKPTGFETRDGKF